MYNAVFGQDEVETGEQADYKEKYQRIGKCKQEARDHVAPVVRGCIDFGGFQRTSGVFLERYIPKAASTTPPISCIISWLLSMKSVMKLRQNPVRRQYIRSLNAAPMPVKRAGSRPLLSVRCMTSIPIGPIGADIRTPMAMPRGNMCKICSIAQNQTKLSISVIKCNTPVKKYTWKSGLYLTLSQAFLCFSGISALEMLFIVNHA